MRDFLTVLSFEFKSMIKKKSFLISTIIIALVTFAITFLPTLFNEEDLMGESINQTVLKDVGFVMNNLDETQKNVLLNHPQLKDIKVYDSIEQMKEDLKAETLQVGFEVKSLLEMKTIYFNRTLAMENEQVVNTILRDSYRNLEYEKLGINPENLNKIEMQQVKNEVEILGRDSMSNYFINYVLSFAIYMVVMLYGSSVATGIAREKDDRTMELLITSTKPRYLITGKVFGISLGTLFQVVLIFIAGFIGYHLFKGQYPAFISLVLQSSMTFDLLLIYVFYFGFGFVLYMFLFSAVGSIVSRVEDVSNAIMPVMVLIMIALFVSMMSFGDVNGTMSKVASFIPFTSFLVMPTRYLMSIVPTFELLLSMFIMVLTTILFAYLSMKIYRWGTLYYGNRINIFKILKKSLSSKD